RPSRPMTGPIRLDPEHAVAWNNRGLALASQGRYDEAIQAYDEALRLDPELAQAMAAKSLVIGEKM
ncbi:MAG: tetratricopeptide repeat protein, partial [Methanosarcinales archaeon]|nr:tetratricopeptide repeat protein [Methanosarcinales archaeon]